VKKVLVIILLLIHSAASSGTVLSAHYCMGDFSGLRFGHNNKEVDHCSTCGMKDMGCCHDEPKVIKLDNNQIQQTSIGLSDFKIPFLPPAPSYTSFSIVLIKGNFLSKSSSHLGRTPSYVLNCSYRI
jgi:hypothetical protein